MSAPYSQDFNTLADSGSSNSWTDDSTIAGWYSNRTTYRASSGSDNAGSLYSFGSSAADRALGSIGSNSAGTIYYAVRMVNDTGSTISELTVNFTGEQWRNGGNTSAHTLHFAYQVGSGLTDPTAGSWTDVNTLDFTSPTTGASSGALDGNDAANRTLFSESFPVAIAWGQEIMLRWQDPNDSGSDHGLSIDDLSVVSGSTGFPALCNEYDTGGWGVECRHFR